MIVQSLFARDMPASHDILRASGIPVLASIDHAVRVVSALRRRGHRLATATERSSLELHTPPESASGGTRVLAERPRANSSSPRASTSATGSLPRRLQKHEPPSRGSACRAQ
jgi:hypothetical protein